MSGGGAKVNALAKHFDSADLDSGVGKQPQRTYAGNIYHPAPTPMLEININQHNPAPSGSCYSASPVSSVRHSYQPPCPLSPPPPPPQEHYTNPDYCTVQNVKASAPPYSPPSGVHPVAKRASILRRKASATLQHFTLRDLWTSRRNAVMFRASVVELLLSLAVLAGGCWCAMETDRYCPYLSGVWSGALFVTNSLLGLVTARAGVVNLYVAHLVLSLVSMAACVGAAFLAALNWRTMGIGTHHAFCVVGVHDANQISYIFRHMHKYDFSKCLHDFKIGTAVNSVQFAVSFVLLLLFMFSAILCMKKTCTRCR